MNEVRWRAKGLWSLSILGCEWEEKKGICFPEVATWFTQGRYIWLQEFTLSCVMDA